MESGAGDSSPGPDTTSSTVPAHSPFGVRLQAAVEARESQVVLGLDPDPARLWPPGDGHAADADSCAALLERLERHGGDGVPKSLVDASTAVLRHCHALIDAVAGSCIAIKPQLACFERLGGLGGLVLEDVAAHARRAGLLVIADGKRGDVPVTAAAYAQALLSGMPVGGGDRLPGLAADAITANPLLGRDSLQPLVEAAHRGGQGVFVLVRTSNAGAADFMDAPLRDGRRLWELLAATVNDLGARGDGGHSGVASIGAVTGATAPEHLERMRELMPRAPFLLPGIGAQGGDVGDLAPAFAPGRAGGLVTASRSIARAHEASGEEPASAARREAERLRTAAWSLA